MRARQEFEQLHRRQDARADEAAQLRGGKITGLGHAGASLASSAGSVAAAAAPGEVHRVLGSRHQRAARAPEQMVGAEIIATKPCEIMPPGFARLYPGRPREAGHRRGLKAQPRPGVGPLQKAEQLRVGHGVDAGDQAMRHGPGQLGGPRHRQPVRRRAVVEAEIVDRHARSEGHAREHAGRGGRLGEEAVDGIAEDVLQAEGDAARRAADAAGEMDEQRMARIHHDARLGELLRQPDRGGRVAEEQRQRVLVVNEIGGLACRGEAPAGGDSRGVVARVLNHLGARLPQPRLLPSLGVARHVHHGAEAERRRHRADAEAEVASAAHGDGMAPEQRPRRRRDQRVLARRCQPVPPHQILGEAQHLKAAAARLDGADDRQCVVPLQPDAAPWRVTQHRGGVRQGLQCGLDPGLGQFGKEPAQDGAPAFEGGRCASYLVPGQGLPGQCLGGRGEGGIEPQ